MKRHIITGLAAFVFAMGLSLILSSPSMAVHRGAGDLVCGGCHTMHNSQGNQSMGGPVGGAGHLMRASNAYALCASCHFSTGAYNGTTFAPANVTPPTVWFNGTGPAATWDQTQPFGNLPAGGFFDMEVTYAGGTNVPALTPAGQTVAGGYGHSLSAAAAQVGVTPPGGDSAIDKLRCFYCHDPHGTNVDTSVKVNRFRNLHIDVENGNPAVTNANIGVKFNAGVMGSWVGGITGEAGAGGNFVGVGNGTGGHYWPIYNPATGATAGNSNFYGKGITDMGVAAPEKGAMSRWCSQCHDAWHEDLTPGNIDVTNGAYNKNASALETWKRHPIDKGVYSNEVNKDGAADIDWNNYVTQSTGAANLGKGLPTTNGAGAAVYYADSEGDRVMCLTCHFPHAGPYKDALRWQHTNATDGAQGIPSNRGCQQCHNRGA